MRKCLVLLALLAVAACNPTPAAGPASSPAGSAAAPVIDGFEVTPKAPIEASETYTFVVKAHATDGASLRYEWTASAGQLSARNAPSTTWRAVKPGEQLKPGRVRVEVSVTGGGPAKGGTAFLTIGPDGRASFDAFAPNVYGDSAGPTPTPALTPPPSASPLPSAEPEPTESPSPAPSAT